MNNKGFAISTLIYGLSIMGVMLIAIIMGTMSNNRSNTKEITNSIENELILYGRSEKSFDDGNQSYIVPDGQSGWYRIELWGAQGGEEYKNAYGAYTTGVIKLIEGDVLYFHVGERSETNGPGEASDVRVINGDYNDPNSYNTRIMVAAGGGIGDNAVGGTTVGYNNKSLALGGTVQADGTFDDAASNKNLLAYPTDYSVVADLAQFNPGPIGANGGGSGYYSSKDGNIGGISYIAGYAGSGEALLDPDDATTSYYFIDGQMFPGVNRGKGKAKITKILDYEDTVEYNKLKKLNSKLNKVTHIRDCLKVTSDKNNEIPVTLDTFANIIAMKDGKRVTGTLAPTLEVSGSYKCRTLTLDAAGVDLDEFAVWHTPNGRDYFNHRIEVKKNGSSSWNVIKNDNKSTRSMTEVANGYHVSAYQPDSTTNLPATGNYYIVPVLDENKGLTSQSEAVESPLTSSYIVGDKSQIWSIEKVDDKLKKNDNEYRIIDLNHYFAMEVKENQNKVGNNIIAMNKFSNNRRKDSQIWEIEPVGDGTFAIKSTLTKAESTVDSGYIVPMKVDNIASVKIGKKDLNCQKYRLISLEYRHG